MAEYGAHDPFQEVGCKFPRQLEFDSAGRGADFHEPPLAVQAAKGSRLQRDDDRFRRMVCVVGREMQLDAVEVDVDANSLAAGACLLYAYALAPRQELGVELDLVDEMDTPRAAGRWL